MRNGTKSTANSAGPEVAAVLKAGPACMVPAGRRGECGRTEAGTSR